jgi:hypothetical protein
MCRNEVTVKRWGSLAVAVMMLGGLSGCEIPTPMAVSAEEPEPFIETPPAPDPEPEEEVVVEEVFYASTAECMAGNWAVDNDTYGLFFQANDRRISAIEVRGSATMTIEGTQFRMFFEEWEIRYDTGEPAFLEVRNGSETVEFELGAGDVLTVVDREDETSFELFSLVGADGDLVGIASTDPGYLDLEGTSLTCTSDVLEFDGIDVPLTLKRL